MSPKYPRTAHLPYSPGGTSDDRRIESVQRLLGCSIIMTEKMDGSNVCLESGACYARSHGSAPSHPSFAAFKAFHASVRHLIAEETQIFGEWLWAQHSIGYSALPSYFQAFGVRDLKTGTWASWPMVEIWAFELGTVTVPVLSSCEIRSEPALRALVEDLAARPSVCGGDREGVVVRVADSFADAEFAITVAKYVRKDHVQTSDHWKSQEIVRNELRRDLT